jgi:hypothetical protein
LFPKPQFAQRGGRAPPAPAGLVETELHYAISLERPVWQCQGQEAGERRL